MNFSCVALGLRGWLPVLTAATIAAPAFAQTFRLNDIRRDATGAVVVEYQSRPDAYYLLHRGTTLPKVNLPIDTRLGIVGTSELRDSAAAGTARFYRVLELPLAQPRDTDGDGIDDVYELEHPAQLNPLDAADASQLAPGAEGKTYLQVYVEQRAPLTTLSDTSPFNGEDGVAVTRETVFRLTRPLSTDAVLTTTNVYATFAGRRVLSRIELSADRRAVTLFHLENLPASARVRVTFAPGDTRDDLGRQLDLAGTGQTGSAAQVDFDTLSITPVGGTAVIGHVYASERVPDGSGGFTNLPLAGVTITVDGAEETVRTTTDAAGFFRLMPAPAGRFFVHVDGRTALGSDWPDGAYYPFVGKAWEAVAGAATNLANGTGEIFLPLVPATALQSVSPTQETRITFAGETLSKFPELAGVEVRVPPNALFSDNGTRGGRVGIAPVPPERLPEPLPPGLNLPLVITIQTDGPQNFDRPVPVRFPNLPDRATGRTLPPGAKSTLWSFSHDTGRWAISGLMTVSADGRFVETDPGFGVLQPGWHGTRPGSTTRIRHRPQIPPDSDWTKTSNAFWNGQRDRETAAGRLIMSTLGNVFSLLPDRPQRDLGQFVLTPLIGGLENTFDDRVDLANRFMDHYLEGSGDNLRFDPNSPESRAVQTHPGFDRPRSELDLATQSRIRDYIRSHPGTDSFQLPPQRVNTYANFYGTFGTDNQLSVSLGQAGVTADSGPVTVVRNPEGGYTAVYESQYDVTDRYEFNDNDNSFLDNIARDQSVAGNARAFDVSIGISEVQVLQIPLNPSPAPGGSLHSRGALMDEPDARPGITLGKSLLITPEIVVGGTRYLVGTNGTVVRINSANEAEGPFWVRVQNLNTGLILLRKLVSDLRQVEFISPPRAHCEVAVFSVSGWVTGSVRLLAGLNGETTTTPVVPLFPSSNDADRDGLPDEAEQIVGTDPTRPDTDGDGIGDSAEVQGGTNPLDNFPAVTGIIGTLPLPGVAKDVCLDANRAFVALGSGGLAVVDVTRPDAPTIIAQVSTPGDARRVACDRALVAVASGPAGLAIVDISDPPAAFIANQLIRVGSANCVVAADGTAYVGTEGGEVIAVHLATGTLGARVNCGSAIHDLAFYRDYLLVLTSSALKVVPFKHDEPTVLATQPVSLFAEGLTGLRRVSVGGTFAYVTSYPGYSIVDLSSPAQPTLVGNAVEHGPNSFKQILPTGSGIGVAAVGVNPREDSIHDVWLYDLRNPDVRTSFTAQFQTPGHARAVALHRGLAFVADGASGLQTLNFLAADLGRTPPLVRLDATFPLNPAKAESGSPVAVIAEASDDVLVREVEFYLDGKRVGSDGNYPFEHRFRVPTLASGRTSFAIRARAIDTGGNATWSDEISVVIEPDTTPPRARPAVPSANGYAVSPAKISVLFNEPINETSVTAERLTLKYLGQDRQLGTDDDLPVRGEVRYLSDSRSAELRFPVLTNAGRYEAVLLRGVIDLSGNATTNDLVWAFEVVTGTDTDGDGLTDEFELANGLDPKRTDENNNGIPDSLDDFDGDGLTNGEEMLIGTNPRQQRTFDGVLDSQLDRDGDYLTDIRELGLGTDRSRWDTDGDGWNDEIEIATGDSPLRPNAYLRGIRVGRQTGHALLEDGPQFLSAQGEVLRIGEGQAMQATSSGNVLRLGGPNANGHSVILAQPPTRVRIFGPEAADLTPYELPRKGAFVIEAEDYDYDGGEPVPAASVMPYLGGAYSNRVGVLNVDYFKADAADSQLYRPLPAPNNVNLLDNLFGRHGLERPGWTVRSNFRVASPATGDWQQYTRSIASGEYWVWAALSHSGTSPDQLSGSLDLVAGDSTRPAPALLPLGAFNAPGSGGSGRNALVLLRDTGGAPAIVTVNQPTNTFRFNLGSGDLDWFVLVPVTSGP